MVDAVTGEVLHRQNQVEHSAEPQRRSRARSPRTECGDRAPLRARPTTTTRRSPWSPSAVNAGQRHRRQALRPRQRRCSSSGDLRTSPEVADLHPRRHHPGRASTRVQVCPFDDRRRSAARPVRRRRVARSDTGGARHRRPGLDPRVALLPGQPDARLPPDHDAEQHRRRLLDPRPATTAPRPPGALGQPTPPSAPWDHASAAVPTLTTVGNNASDPRGVGQPADPRRPVQAPVSPTREYTDEFTDAWNNTQVRPGPAGPGRQRHQRLGDQPVRRPQPDARLQLLPRLHRGELQPAAGQRRPRRRRAGDPEIGNAQAGALTGGQPVVPRPRQRQPDHPAGRRPRHHQPVPLPADRRRVLRPVHRRRRSTWASSATSTPTPSATGWSAAPTRASPPSRAAPWASRGATWSPRSTSSPTATPTAATSGPSAPTPPATRRPRIRDYAINKNPLNYSDYGFDTTGAEVHADGEIWNGTQWQVRQALVEEVQRPVPLRRQGAAARAARRRTAATRPRSGRAPAPATAAGCS